MTTGEWIFVMLMCAWPLGELIAIIRRHRREWRQMKERQEIQREDLRRQAREWEEQR